MIKYSVGDGRILVSDSGCVEIDMLREVFSIQIYESSLVFTTTTEWINGDQESG